MAIETGKNIIDGVILSTTSTSIFLVTNNLNRVKIDSISFINFGIKNATITGHIVSKGGTIGNGKLLFKNVPIRVDETFLAPSLNGQGINEGGNLQVSCDTANSVGCTATGTLYSS